MLILKFHCHCKGNEISVLTYCSFSQVSQCKRLNKWAILTWRNIADSAGPCHAGVPPWQRWIWGPRWASEHHNPRQCWVDGALHCGSLQDGPLLLYEFLPPSQQLNHHQLPSGLPAPLLVADVMGGSDPFLDTPIPPIYPSHPHRPPPPRSIIENSPWWIWPRRWTGLRNNIHHLSQHLDSPVSQLILAHPDFPTMLKDVKNKSWSHQSVFFGVTVHWWKVAC